MMRPALLAAALVFAAGCGKTPEAACDQVRAALVRRDDDAFRAQCLADLRSCDAAHPDDNAPIYNCLGSARDRGQVAACMRSCANPRFHGRSFQVFGERLRAP